MLPLAPFPAPQPVRRRARAAALALVTTVALAGCGADADDPVPASDQSSSPEPSATSPDSPSSEATSEPPDRGDDRGGVDTAVPVYFAGDGPGGRTRLFREFHRVEGDPLTEAARLVAGGGEPVDPDYRTLWPQVEIASVSATDGVLLVEIPSDGFTERPDGMTRRDARLAVQQLVYTLQGVQQERVPVMIEREGGLPLFGLPTDAPFRAASALRTLNLVNITSPAEGDTVTGDTLTVTGVANSFEASGPCRLSRVARRWPSRPTSPRAGWRTGCSPSRSSSRSTGSPARSSCSARPTTPPAAPRATARRSTPRRSP